MNTEKERPQQGDTNRPRPSGKKQPYPVNDPGIAGPAQQPGSEPDYLPGSNPDPKPQL